jgi:hypothetical protein
VACFALTTLPCHALSIGRAAVISKIGEPLDAYVLITLAPGERIDNSCLSAGGRDDFPQSDHTLIRDVQLSLFTTRNAIRITTLRPLGVPAVSMALRIHCVGGPLTVRALNLYLNPRSADVSTNDVPTNVVSSSLPGTSITVRSGDTVYGFARTIFPKNEKAVGELALAIALANPTLFPDGKPRPLRVGERVTIPDLRTVQRIVAESGIAPESVFPPPPKTAMSHSAASKSGRSRKAARSGRSTKNVSGNRAKSVPIPNLSMTRPSSGTHWPATRRTGPLGLILALTVDLQPSQGMTEARRAKLRQELRPAVARMSGTSSIPGDGGLATRVAMVGEAQDGINAQIDRLSSQVEALQKSVAVRGRSVRPPVTSTTQVPASSTVPSSAAASNSVPSSVSASNSSPSSAAASNSVPSSASASSSVPSSAAESSSGIFSFASAAAQSTLSWWNQSAWWKWPASAGVMLLLLAAGIVYRPRAMVQTSATDDKERISNILEQAHAAAIPVLGEESIPPGGNEFQSEPDTQRDDFYDESARTVIDPSARHAPSTDAIPALYPDLIDPSTRGVYNQGLKREMADALDGARSMFSDVDRFIVLGRAENAISMLEFQIETHPEDRDAWVKLMAIYEQEGMSDEFERTYAAFGKKFSNG